MRIFHLSQSEFDEIKETAAPIDITTLREDQFKSAIKDVREILENANGLLSVFDILQNLTKRYPDRWAMVVYDSRMIVKVLRYFKDELGMESKKTTHPGRGGKGPGKPTFRDFYGLKSKFNFDEDMRTPVDYKVHEEQERNPNNQKIISTNWYVKEYGDPKALETAYGKYKMYGPFSSKEAVQRFLDNCKVKSVEWLPA